MGNTVPTRKKKPSLVLWTGRVKIPVGHNTLNLLPRDTDGDFYTIARLNRMELPQLGKRTVAVETPPETFHLAIKKK